MKEKMVVNEPPTKPFIVFKNSKFEVGEFQRDFTREKQILTTISGDSDSSKSKELNSGDESDSSKSEEPQVEPKGEESDPQLDDANFPPLGAENFKRKIVKVEISDQFFVEKKEFDVEKAFNPKVKHIFGKMIDGKANSVKEFYEKKMKEKKPGVGNSESPKVCQAWENFFN